MSTVNTPWLFPAVQGSHTDETQEVNIEDDSSVLLPPKLSTDEKSTPSLSTENPTHEDNLSSNSFDENLPLASALPPPIQPYPTDQVADLPPFPPPDDLNETDLLSQLE